jgi:hypothetical protein
LEQAPEAIVGIFEGKNFGKAVVQIAENWTIFIIALLIIDKNSLVNKEDTFILLTCPWKVRWKDSCL